jgi:hypothetical protein
VFVPGRTTRTKLKRCANFFEDGIYGALTAGDFYHRYHSSACSSSLIEASSLIIIRFPSYYRTAEAEKTREGKRFRRPTFPRFVVNFYRSCFLILLASRSSFGVQEFNFRNEFVMGSRVL